MGSPKLPAPLNKFASKGHAEHLPFQLSPTQGLLIDDAFRRQQAVADKALFPKYLGKRRGLVWNSFGKILPKVGIYPRHWYSESLNYTCFRELNVLFLWVAYVNMSQARSKDSWKWNSILQVQVDVPDMKGESGVKAGSKQDPKTFKSSSNLGIKVQFNRRKLLVRSSFLFWVRFLRQDRKDGFLNISLLAVSSRSKEDLRETRLIVTVGAPSVEESCSQAVVMSSFLFRFRRGNSFSCTTGLNNLFF